MKYLLAILFILHISIAGFSQEEEISTDLEVIDTTSITEAPQLLPEHYLLTQRLLWSEHGLIRMIPGNELSETNRLREVKWRTYMLKAHRFLGYATILGMVGQAYTGAKLYSLGSFGEGESKEYDKWKDLHGGFAGFACTTYFASGGLMLFAPPWKSDRAPGYSNTKLHKYLAMVHMTSMIASLITADGAGHPGFVRDFHRATAFAAFGTYFISTVIIHF